MIQKTWRERVIAAEKRRGHRFIKEDILAWGELRLCCVGEYAQPVAETLGIRFEDAWGRLNGKKNFSEQAHEAILFHDTKRLWKILDQIEARALEVKRVYKAAK